jgi:hypothetical protein
MNPQSTAEVLVKRTNTHQEHNKLVEAFVKQGAKFRNTVKYGFPMVSRQTIQESRDKLNKTSTGFGKKLTLDLSITEETRKIRKSLN